MLALLSLSGCAQEKEENTKQSDPQAREAILQCCETIFGSTEETGAYHIRVTDERDGGRVDEYDCPRGADERGYGNSPVYALTEPSMYGGRDRGMRRRSRTGTIASNGLVAEISYGDKMRSAFMPPWGDRSPTESENWQYEHPGGNVLRLTQNGTETAYYEKQ